MANNRMWLVHRPTGERICIGKRMGFGWYLPHGFNAEMLRSFFEYAEASSDFEDQDDFSFEMEEPGPNANPMSFKYDEKGKTWYNLYQNRYEKKPKQDG